MCVCVCILFYHCSYAALSNIKSTIEESEQTLKHTKHRIIAGIKQLQLRCAFNQLIADHVGHFQRGQWVWRACFQAIINCRRVMTLLAAGRLARISTTLMPRTKFTQFIGGLCQWLNVPAGQQFLTKWRCVMTLLATGRLARISTTLMLTTKVMKFISGMWQWLSVPARTQFLSRIYVCFFLATIHSAAAVISNVIFYYKWVIAKFWEAWNIACIWLLCWTTLLSQRLARVLFVDLRDTNSWASHGVMLMLTRFLGHFSKKFDTTSTIVLSQHSTSKSQLAACKITAMIQKCECTQTVWAVNSEQKINKNKLQCWQSFTQIKKYREMKK